MGYNLIYFRGLDKIWFIAIFYVIALSQTISALIILFLFISLKITLRRPYNLKRRSFESVCNKIAIFQQYFCQIWVTKPNERH